jgi:hypothetical protein
MSSLATSPVDRDEVRLPQVVAFRNPKIGYGRLLVGEFRNGLETVRENRIDREFFGKQEIDVPFIHSFYRHHPPMHLRSKVSRRIPSHKTQYARK